ncbi:hypothetical protein TTHERM_00374950 (macronuclear) [Tetrahymena thermophila SB210]|uniref:Mitochondrial pyruvate carrier n=1 Tax=Tetrahymena thermophila (strain SB210) TaxID=312017 RepID=I7MDL9_TETTS|nr:hypothetical protein TTHERM_00374950 [Tetrahymena thermophila SB210]EAR89378.2 hypothetical protein TTHERM_00374950 [Tetrahymena thermophila SB210]|eukprot:XP_001009623.2 hypothetical protein TTHERM_00374950 [Tetrahymena thermophila SB210]
MQAISAFINSPVGPKTTHFWGPVTNCGFVAQGALDWERPPEKTSRDMQFVLTVYSMTFMRFAWRVQPRNYFLLAVHFSNVFVQGRLLMRRVNYERSLKQ